jgi:hypothetical protein
MGLKRKYEKVKVYCWQMTIKRYNQNVDAERFGIAGIPYNQLP